MHLLKAVLIIVVLVFPIQLGAQKTFKIKKGNWTGRLELRDNYTLPFLITNEGKGKEIVLAIHNGEEKIYLDKGVRIGDSIQFTFPAFNSKLILIANNKKHLKGYWVNLNKTNYRVPFTATYGYDQRFPVQLSNKAIPNKWEITFDPNTDEPYKSVGLFHQKGDKIEGTFLTETGDYRFLEGNRTEDSLYLSCFDGSHAFLFTARIVNDSIYGDFLSGKHWKGDWNGRVNNDFELRHPDSLTYTVNSNPFTFTVKDLQGNDYTFPQKNHQNKVTIIQIMGTWCPNCMDETHYFKSLYDKYHTQGLEIVSVGYEVGKEYSEYVEKINRLKERYNLPFTFLVGGNANKGLAAQHFSMLNNIISFPTAIYIGRDGTIKKIHTGFNGPGTGQYYTEYVKETDLFIQELLKEK